MKYLCTFFAVCFFAVTHADDVRLYSNRLQKLKNPGPLLNDYPEFIHPLKERQRFEAPALVMDKSADLYVRAWRFSYNARGIIEMPNRLQAASTAIIVVHPWGIDDAQGWRTPEPAGVADFCTKEKNNLAARHTRKVIGPLLNRLRPRIGFVMYSLPGSEDPIRKKLYRSVRSTPTAEERQTGIEELKDELNSFAYQGSPLPTEFRLSKEVPVVDYFRQFPGLDANSPYNPEGFWKLPIPVTSDLKVHPQDVVIYDDEGYEALRNFLKAHRIRHVLLAGYATDMCYCRTTAGYENLRRDFNVFLVGDASLATFPASDTPRIATTAHLAFASLQNLVTQTSWIKLHEGAKDKE